MVTIYKITSPSNRIYIGQAKDFKRRIREYKRAKCKAQTLLYNSIMKYGFESHKIEIVAIVEDNFADEKETYYINYFNCFNSPIGLNLTPGGKRPAPKIGKAHYKAKAVYQFDFEGNLIKKWDCIRDVEREYGFSSTTIGMSIKAKCSSYGFIWSFSEESPGKYRSQRIK